MPKAPVKLTPAQGNGKPYRVVDRRGLSVGSNRLFQSAVEQSPQRTKVDPLHYDTHLNVWSYGRRRLMTMGRWLFSNFPAVTGAILEQAGLASHNFIPQFWGEDRVWGDQAENWLHEWFKICDIAGPPYDFQSWLRLQDIAELRDGDMATLLVDNGDGWPFLQLLPAHRIGSPLSTGLAAVDGGPFDGARIIDGVIVNDYRRSIGYRVLDESGYDTLADVPAGNVVFSFIPDWADQVRGFSRLASAIFDWQDVKDSRSFELLAQKASSAISLIEENETGEVDTAASVITGAATFDVDTKQKTALDTQELVGGTYRYFKNGLGKITAHSYNRPGSDSLKFQEKVLRDCFKGMQWDFFFSVNPAEQGGAGMRIVIDKVNRVIEERRRQREKCAIRVIGWALSKAIKIGAVPMSDEWWKWEFQGHRRLTADAKYDSDVDVQELASGITTEKEVCGRRGEYWEDVQDQRLREKFRKRQRAREIGAEMGMAPDDVDAVLNEPEADKAAAPDDEEDTIANRNRREPVITQNE